MKLSTSLLLAGCVFVAAAVAERFDMKVRNDFFAGFAGNSEALARGMKTCEEALAADPKNAQALVWHGAGLFFESGQAFQKGDAQKGGDLWEKGLAEMDAAVALEPDNVAVLIPRGAVLLTGSRFVPDSDRARPLIEKGVGDFERTLQLQASYFDTMGTHARGELLSGLADGYARLGDTDKAQKLFERIQADLPGSAYAKRAAKWLDTKSLSAMQMNCIGCHTGK